MKRKSYDGKDLLIQKKYKRYKSAKKVDHRENTKSEQKYLEFHGQEMEKHIKSIYPTAIVYNTRPLVVHIPNFMTQQECQQKLAEISPNFNLKCKQSEISLDSDKPVVDTSVRKSSFINSSWKPLGDKLSKIFGDAPKLVGQNLAGQKPIFIRYQHQGIVNSHWDFISNAALSRRYTALIYMNDVPESSGGATSFDDVLEYKTNKSLKIQPKCGDLLLFRVSISHPFQKGAEILDYNHIHKGCEFVATPNCPEKWICQLFMLDLDHPKFSVSYLDRIRSFFNLSPKIKFH